MSSESVIWFYTIGLGSIYIAAIIPIGITINEKPKDILVKGNIG